MATSVCAQNWIAATAVLQHLKIINEELLLSEPSSTTPVLLLSLGGYVDLVNSFPGYRNFTPELKTLPSQVLMPFEGYYTQEKYARDMLDTFINKGINPDRVWTQPFLPADVFQWIEEYPQFGKHAVYLDEDGATTDTFIIAVARLPSLKAQGVNVIPPPINYLFTYDDTTTSTFVRSSYATTAKAAGLDIIAWSFERSGPLDNVEADEDYYYSTFAKAVDYDGQLHEILDILANEMGIVGLFTDWSAIVGYFANCFGLQGPNADKYQNRQ